MIISMHFPYYGKKENTEKYLKKAQKKENA